MRGAVLDELCFLSHESTEGTVVQPSLISGVGNMPTLPLVARANEYFAGKKVSHDSCLRAQYLPETKSVLRLSARRKPPPSSPALQCLALDDYYVFPALTHSPSTRQPMSTPSARRFQRNNFAVSRSPSNVMCKRGRQHAGRRIKRTNLWKQHLKFERSRFSAITCRVNAALPLSRLICCRPWLRRTPRASASRCR